MKKLLLIVVCILIGGGIATGIYESKDKEPIEEEIVEVKEDIADEELEEEISVVTLNIPGYFYEGEDQEDLDKETERYGYISQTLNSDGSVTVELSEEDYNDLLDEITAGFDEEIDDLIYDKKLHFVSIDYLEDYTYFKVIVDDPNNLESTRMYGELLFLIGASYDAYTSNSIDTYSIEYYDIDNELLTTDAFTGTFDDLYDRFPELFISSMAKGMETSYSC